MHKLVSRDSSTKAFDDNMIYYVKIREEMKAIKGTVDVRFVRINLSQLSSAIMEHAWQWVSLLGEMLHQRAKTSMTHLTETINVSHFSV